MRRYIPLILFVGLLLSLLSGCNRTGTPTTEGIPFSPYVEAFTTGKVSRTAPIYLVLNQALDSVDRTPQALKKGLKIKPEVAGDFSFENNRTIVFRPATEFQRNTTYSISADFTDWFGAEGSDRFFTFRFTTLPFSLRAHMQSLDLHPGENRSYDVTAVLYTSDRESPETLESILRFSEANEQSWQHSPDGKRHEVTLRKIPAGDQARPYVISVGKNKLDAKVENLLSFDIPAADDFSLYEIQYATDPERYIEVTFTQLLDSLQEMRGLALIADNASEKVTVEGNKLRLYPDAERKGTVEVQLNSGIKNRSGKPLGETVIRQVEVTADVPAIRFVGSGTIIPSSAQLIVPFQAVYLRGVVVRVIKIFENNVGQFLQVNQLDEQSDLMRVGRLVARKTIFLDEDDLLDLSEWNTFGIDLKEMIEPEPGAIYRIQLSFNRELSVYPCETTEEPRSKEEMLAEEADLFEKEAGRYDPTQGYYYYYEDSFYDDEEGYWDDYNYYERNDPCKKSFYYYNTSVSKNVLATNLGLMAMAGDADQMTVLVHNLLTTLPEKDVTITAHNYQQQEVGRAVTDEQGKASIAFSGGRPFYLMASQGKQRSYLRVDGGSALSLSSFDVSGEVVQRGIKGFIYGDRGVWRPGDTLYLSFMLNDRAQTLPADHPVTLELVNPLGQLYLKKTQTHGILGVYSFDMPTDPDAPTGSWSVNVKVGGVTFNKRVRIETIKPNRLKIDIRTPDKTLLRGEAMDAPMHIEWMTGATARNLEYDIQGTFQSTPTTFDNYNDFVFDDPAKSFSSEESNLISGRTDENGDAIIRAKFEIGSSAPGMLMGNFVTRVFEESGDFSIDAFRMVYSPYTRYAGIKSPQKSRGRQLDTGKQHTYQVASVDYQGQPAGSAELKVTVYKVYWYWWWSSDKSRLASYISDSYNQPVKEFSLTTDANGKATFNLSFTNNEWGTYYIAVKDLKSGHSTGIMNYYDWPYLTGHRDQDGNAAANLLSFKTDKESYVPGEKIAITFESTAGSRAIVNILNGSRVLAISEHECGDKESTLQIAVTEEMQPNAYIYVTLLQPHGNTENDLPIRLYGVAPVTVTSPGSRLAPVISAPEEIKPESRYDITVSEKEGREMAYTLAIVDEGLLDLTRFRTPDPWAAFHAREALGVSTWDLYNYVVGAYGGRIEQLFSIGGDDALDKGPKAIVNRFKPVLQFEGPFLLKKGERKRHTYTMPNYNGRVRIMVVAGNGQAYGNAEKSLFVRKPVMLLGTLPRVIGVFEEMVIPATVFATQEGVGNVKVAITCSDNMEIVGPAEQTLLFQRIEDQQATFRIRVKGNPGAGKVTLTATGQGDKAVYETDIEIRSVRRPQSQITAFILEPGKSWQRNLALPGTDGTNSLTLEMSDVPPINLTSHLNYLLGYPHGCLEQTTSKAFPQIYLKEFASLTRAQEESVEVAVKAVINRMRSYQMSDGSLAYWPGGSYSNGWSTIYAAHFLLEAEAKGYAVSDALKRSVLSSLRRFAREWKPVRNYYSRSEEYTQAYRLYVLALGSMPELGAMNRLKEEQELTDMSKWMLAMAYSQVGRNDVAKSLIEKTTDFTADYSQYDLTYGSHLRDKAVRLMTLCRLNQGTEAATQAKEISAILSEEKWLSTQTTAFSLMALSQYISQYKSAESMEFSYTVAGGSNQVNTPKNIWAETLLTKTGASAAVEVRNTGKATLFGRLVGEGTPNQGEEKAYAHGISLDVRYVDANGRSLDVSNLEQGTTFKAVVTVKNPSARTYRNLALTQVFPAGWEILNTRFTNDGATDENTPGISYQDIRDDRVYSYIDYLPSGREITVSINLSAIYRGRFYLPPVYGEAMYDHLIQANTVGRFIEIR